ncbi:hypothetical protein [Citrobacter freundii]|uniref:hypothetical protein n=1 Tax=Citrobacter freundii TaxID=546 RepID=UPI0018AA6E74|nr:hypothetical protein [Citrobacter freundii]
MDKVNTVLVLLITLSLALIAIFTGIGSVSGSIPIGNSGVSLQATKTFPLLLIIFWLFVWQRFMVLSLHENKPIIDKLILKKINQSTLVYKIFSAKKAGFPGGVGISKWGWNDGSIPHDAPGNHIHYERGFLARRFKFSYFGNDSAGAGKFIHFGPKANNIKSGTLTPLNFGYWKCLVFEVKFLLVRLFDTPVIGQHYIPHAFAWAATLVIFFTYIKQYIEQIFQ